MSFHDYYYFRGFLTTRKKMVIQGVSIPQGFMFNGADIPRLAWTILGLHPMHHGVVNAACLHDYLIVKNHAGHDRDKLFYKQLVEDGIPKWKAKLMYFTVRKWRQIKD